MNDVHTSVLTWLADYLLLTTALSAVTLVMLAAIKQPAQRLAVTKSTLVAFLLLAVLCALPGWSLVHLLAREEPLPNMSPIAIDMSPAPNESAMASSEPLELLPVAPPAPMVAELDHLSPRRSVWRDLNWPALAMYAYAAGAIGVASWLCLGALAAHRLVRSAAAAPAELATLLDELVESLPALHRLRQWFSLIGPEALAKPAAPSQSNVRLLISDKIDVAVAIGVFRPAILLPHDLARTQSEIRNPKSAIDTILAHELAHITNHDVHWLAASRLLLVLLWPQPLFWLLRRRMRLDQELLADAAAAELTSRQTYAEQLVAWARHLPPRPAPRLSAAVGLWEGPSQLRQRIALLVDEHFTVLRNCSRGWRVSTAVGLLAAATALSLITMQPRSVAQTDAIPTAATATGSSSEDASEAQVASYQEAVAESFKKWAQAALERTRFTELRIDDRVRETALDRNLSEALDEFKTDIAQHWPYDDAALAAEQHAYQQSLREINTLASRAKGGQPPPLDRGEAIRSILEIAEKFPDSEATHKAFHHIGHLYSGLKPRKSYEARQMYARAATAKGPLTAFQLMGMVNTPNVTNAEQRRRDTEALLKTLEAFRNLDVLVERLLPPLPVESQDQYLKRMYGALVNIEGFIENTSLGIEFYARQATRRQARPVDNGAAENPQHLSNPAEVARPIPNTILGRATDENGQPIAGVEISLARTWLFDPRREVIDSQLTDAQGRFRFENVVDVQRAFPNGQIRSLEGTSAPRLQIAARKSGRVSAGEPLTQSTVARKGAKVDFTLPPAAAIRGRVTGPNGQPVAGALVSVGMPSADRWEGFQTARTDADGRYEITDAPPLDADAEDRAAAAPMPHADRLRFTRMIFVTHPDFANHMEHCRKIPGTHDIQLKPATVFTGRVIFEENSQPAPDALVQVFTSQEHPFVGPDGRKSQGWAVAVTDAEGRYKIATLPAGTFNLWAGKPGWVNRGIRELQTDAEHVTTAPDLIMSKGGTIKVQLVDAGSGRPVQLQADDRGHFHVRPEAERPAPFSADQHVDAEDGAFPLHALPGTNYLRLGGVERGGEPKWTNAAQHSEPIKVTVSDGETVNIDVPVVDFNEAQAAQNAPQSSILDDGS